MSEDSSSEQDKGAQSPREQVRRYRPEPFADLYLAALEDHLNGNHQGLPPRHYDRSVRYTLPAYQEHTGAVTVQNLTPGKSGRISNNNQLITVYPEALTKDPNVHPNPPTPKKNFFERGVDIINAAIWWVKRYQPQTAQTIADLEKQKGKFVSAITTALIKHKVFENVVNIDDVNLRALTKKDIKKICKSVPDVIQSDVIKPCIDILFGIRGKSWVNKVAELQNIEIEYLREIGRPSIGTVFAVHDQYYLEQLAPIDRLNKEKGDFLDQEALCRIFACGPDNVESLKKLTRDFPRIFNQASQEYQLLNRCGVIITNQSKKSPVPKAKVRDMLLKVSNIATTWCASTQTPIGYMSEEQITAMAQAEKLSPSASTASFGSWGQISESMSADAFALPKIPNPKLTPGDQYTKPYSDNNGHGARNFALNRFMTLTVEHGGLQTVASVDTEEFCLICWSNLSAAGIKPRNKSEIEPTRWERVYKGYLVLKQIYENLEFQFDKPIDRLAYMQIMYRARKEENTQFAVNLIGRATGGHTPDNETMLLADNDLIFDLWRAELATTGQEKKLIYMNLGVNRVNREHVAGIIKLESETEDIINSRGFWEYCNAIDDHILSLKGNDDLYENFIATIKVFRKSIKLDELRELQQELNEQCNTYRTNLLGYWGSKNPSAIEPGLIYAKEAIDRLKLEIHNIYAQFNNLRKISLHHERLFNFYNDALQDNLRSKDPNLEQRKQLNIIVSYLHSLTIYFNHSHYNDADNPRVFEFQERYLMNLQDIGWNIAGGCKDNIDRGAMLEIHLQRHCLLRKLFGSRDSNEITTADLMSPLRSLHDCGARALSLAYQKPGAEGGAFTVGTKDAEANGYLETGKAHPFAKLYKKPYVHGIKLNQSQRKSPDKISVLINPILKRALDGIKLSQKNIRRLNVHLFGREPNLPNVNKKSILELLPRGTQLPKSFERPGIIDDINKWNKMLWLISPYNRESFERLKAKDENYNTLRTIKNSGKECGNAEIFYNQTRVQQIYIKETEFKLLKQLNLYQIRLIRHHAKLKIALEIDLQQNSLPDNGFDLLLQEMGKNDYHQGITSIAYYRQFIRRECNKLVSERRHDTTSKEDDLHSALLFGPYSIITDNFAPKINLIQIEKVVPKLTTLAPRKFKHRGFPYLIIELFDVDSRLCNTGEFDFGGIYYKASNGQNAIRIELTPLVDADECNLFIRRGLFIAQQIWGDQLKNAQIQVRHVEPFASIGDERVEYANLCRDLFLNTNDKRNQVTSRVNVKAHELTCLNALEKEGYCDSPTTGTQFQFWEEPEHEVSWIDQSGIELTVSPPSSTPSLLTLSSTGLGGAEK